MLVRVLGVLLAVASALCLSMSARFAAIGYGPVGGAAVVQAQVSQLRAELTRGAGGDMQQLFPEGSYFLRALTAMAAVRTPDPDLTWIRALRDGLDAEDSVAVFGSGMVPEHGIFQSGWTLAVAVEVAEVSGAAADRAAVERRAVVVETVLRASRSGFLESYPGQYWPCDNVVAAAALARAAALLDKPGWLSTLRSWRERADAAKDPRLQLLPHRVDADGQSLEGPRGTSQSIVQAFWPALAIALDGAVDTGTWARFREAFVVRRAGLLGVLEYPRGATGVADVDSGPLVLGVSASASAVTLAAARAVGDLQLATDLEREAELLGLPLEWGGRRWYGFGVLPIGDAFLAWARSTPAATALPRPASEEQVGRPPWFLFVGTTSLASAGLLVLAVIALGGRRRPGRRSNPTRPT